MVAINSSPAATSSSPIPIGNRLCTLTVRRPAMGATRKDITVIGRNRTPAAKGP